MSWKNFNPFSLISEGIWIWMNVDKTTDSVDYWIFLMILSNNLKIWIKKYSKPVKLMVDNASIHLSLSSKRTATFYNFEIRSLPPYSPNFAPVEMVFGNCKKTIVKSLQNKVIDFSKPSGQKEIYSKFEDIWQTHSYKYMEKVHKGS